MRGLILFIGLFFLFANASPCFGQTFSWSSGTEQNLVPDSIEYQALKALYEKLGGDQWRSDYNWFVGSTAAEMKYWYGVTVKNGDVSRLNLTNNNLTGELPSEIGLLTQLEDLGLVFNNLSGRIPGEITSLTKLSGLDLRYNKLSGNLPDSLFKLSALSRLHLSNNLYSGAIPEVIFDLENLRILDLANNQFSGELSANIANLSQLYMLSLGNNALTGELPSALGSLPQLSYLMLANNDFSGAIPASVGNLPNLGTLSLSGNQISGALPNEMLNCSKLELLEISDNNITAIPSFEGFANNANLSLGLENNLLSFAELEKLYDPSDSSLYVLDANFTPQRASSNKVPASLDPSMVQEQGFYDKIPLVSSQDGEFTHYQWLKWKRYYGSLSYGTWEVIPDLQGVSATINPASAADSGYYVAQKTNAVVGGLTLYDAYHRFFYDEAVSDSIPPAAPTNVLVFNHKVDGADLAWSVVNDSSEVGYHVYVNGGKNNSSLLLNNQYTLSGLAEGNLYTIEVRAVDEAGNESLPSNAVFLTPGDYLKRSFSILSGSDDSEEWATGEVHSADRSLELGENTLTPFAGNQLVVLRFDSLDIPAGAYIEDAWIQFVAQDTASMPAELSIATELADSSLTVYPSPYNISQRTYAHERIAWSPAAWFSPGAEGLAERTPSLARLVRLHVAGEAWKRSNAISFLVEGSGIRKAYAMESGSPASLHVVYSATAPKEPANLMATAETDHILLSWSDQSTGESGFVIERKSIDSDFVIKDTVSANRKAYIDFSAHPESSYRYRVFAYNALGNSAYTNEVTAELLPSLPHAPSGLLAKGVGRNQTYLQWQDEANNEAGYLIELKKDDQWLLVDSLKANKTRYIHYKSSPEPAYLYQVKAYNKQGNSEASNSAYKVGNLSVIEPIRINAGSTSSLSIDTVAWENDQFFVGGKAVATDQTNQPLLSNYRKGQKVQYNFSLEAAGNYRLRLHFFEHEFTVPGSRLFNVLVNDSILIEDLDIVAHGGHLNPIVLEKTLLLTKPALKVAFEGRIEDAFISAIELVYLDNPIRNRFFVRKQAPTGAKGKSWEDAFSSLRDALEIAGQAADSLSITEVWVAKGNYLPSTDQPSESFTIPPYTHVYGGFKGDETAVSERNIWEDTTAISGDIGTPYERADNLQQLISSMGAGSLLDGFTIRHANGDSAAVRGGGVNIHVSSNMLPPRLRNMRMLENTANEGGGIYIHNESQYPILLENIRLDGNIAVKGGGIYLNSGVLRVINGSYVGNVAQRGGGLYLSSTGSHTVELVNNTITTNQCDSTETSGGLYAEIVDLRILNSIIWDNYSSLTEDTVVFSNVDNHLAGAVQLVNNLIQDWTADTLNYNIAPTFSAYPWPGSDFSWQQSMPADSTTNFYGDLQLIADKESFGLDKGEELYYHGNTTQSDAVGHYRFFNATGQQPSELDIGAYENQQSIEPPVYPVRIMLSAQLADPQIKINTQFGQVDTTFSSYLPTVQLLDQLPDSAESLVPIKVSFLQDGKEIFSVFSQLNKYTGLLGQSVFQDSLNGPALPSPYYQVDGNHLTLLGSWQEEGIASQYFNLSEGQFFKVGTPILSNLSLNESDLDNYSFSIYDFSGNLIYETNDLTDSWTGQQANGNPIRPGLYTYSIFINSTLHKGQFLAHY